MFTTKTDVETWSPRQLLACRAHACPIYCTHCPANTLAKLLLKLAQRVPVKAKREILTQLLQNVVTCFSQIITSRCFKSFRLSHLSQTSWQLWLFAAGWQDRTDDGHLRVICQRNIAVDSKAAYGCMFESFGCDGSFQLAPAEGYLSPSVAPTIRGRDLRSLDERARRRNENASGPNPYCTANAQLKMLSMVDKPCRFEPLPANLAAKARIGTGRQMSDR